MAQPLITNFYNKRKRGADGLNAKSKVLVLDEVSNSSIGSSSSGSSSYREVKVLYSYQKEKKLQATELITGKGNFEPKKLLPSSEIRRTARTQKNNVPTKVNASDIRLAFQPKVINEATTPISPTKPDIFIKEKNDQDFKEKVDNGRIKTPEKRVVFELLGGLSPQKKVFVDKMSSLKSENVNSNNKESVDSARKELGLKTPKKELSLFEIRNRLAGSSKLFEIRESMKNFKKREEQLKELELKKHLVANPQLHKFTSIDLEVPVSPQKACLSSPLKGSPIKSPLKSPMKAPAYQRLAHLIQPGVPSLVLPYTYRMLSEIFRCTDTVASMFFNRKETITFQKLKAGVQEMLRRNFTEHHLGQIKGVFPDAFEISVQKIAVMGFSSKSKHELVVLPKIDSHISEVTENNSHTVMTPSVLVERRETFHKRLLEIVKDHHDEFLCNLDPPVIIPRSKLSRWHPDFELEKVPVVKPAALPQAPSEDKFCTAKDVLDRAKTIFGCNQRMEKALLMVSEQMKKDEKSNSQLLKDHNETNSSLLKGVPKALLDKIRAKQAAKALVAMTRTPAEDQEAMQLLRLPEIARILRNIFVAEKKCVLALEVAVTKLSGSYRETLSSEELEQHIRLLIKCCPGWLQILHVRKIDYLKISKDTDMSSVMNRLQKLATEKNSNS